MKKESLIKLCEQEDYKLPEYTDKDKIPLECINCILDDILDTPEETRKFWISLYEEESMKIECRLTGKSHLITKEFFKNIKWE